jgi:hypothetical protein
MKLKLYKPQSDANPDYQWGVRFYVKYQTVPDMEWYTAGPMPSPHGAERLILKLLANRNVRPESVELIERPIDGFVPREEPADSKVEIRAELAEWRKRNLDLVDSSNNS